VKERGELKRLLHDEEAQVAELGTVENESKRIRTLNHSLHGRMKVFQSDIDKKRNMIQHKKRCAATLQRSLDDLRRQSADLSEAPLEDAQLQRPIDDIRRPAGHRTVGVSFCAGYAGWRCVCSARAISRSWHVKRSRARRHSKPWARVLAALRHQYVRLSISCHASQHSYA
jgi:hypothetical protein